MLMRSFNFLKKQVGGIANLITVNEQISSFHLSFLKSFLHSNQTNFAISLFLIPINLNHLE